MGHIKQKKNVLSKYPSFHDKRQKMKKKKYRKICHLWAITPR